MSSELFSPDDNEALAKILAKGPIDGRALDATASYLQPATLPVSQELLRFSRATGSESLVHIQQLPHLSLDAQERLGQSILALNNLPSTDKNEADQLLATTRAIDAWASYAHAEIRTPLILGANALRSINRLSGRRVAILGAALTRFCGLPLPEYPSPEYAGYFCDSLDDVPAHLVRGQGDDREVRAIPRVTMAQCLNGSMPLPAWAAVTARGSMPTMDYMRDYERRFMMARGIFESFISPDEDLGID